MFMPEIPVWCWNLLGEDAVRLSQPTYLYGEGKTRFWGPNTCVARCQYEEWVRDPADGTQSYPYVCGHVALLLADGVYLCRGHSAYYRLGCAWCAEYAARGEDRACPGHHAHWREMGMWCWCCPSGDDEPQP
jgi:hypothetical protein